jgi:hypothetical protein
MMAQMTLRTCLLAASAGLFLNQAALGCRHHRPSFREVTARNPAPEDVWRSGDLLRVAFSSHSVGEGQAHRSE